jgi:hypothetical protein
MRLPFDFLSAARHTRAQAFAELRRDSALEIGTEQRLSLTAAQATVRWKRPTRQTAVSAQHAHGVGAVRARALATRHGTKVGPEGDVRLEASTREFQERSALGPELFL